jgi:hypothetical protein
MNIIILFLRNKFNSYVGHFLNGIFSGNGIFYDDETKGRY